MKKKKKAPSETQVLPKAVGIFFSPSLDGVQIFRKATIALFYNFLSTSVFHCGVICICRGT